MFPKVNTNRNMDPQLRTSIVNFANAGISLAQTSPSCCEWVSKVECIRPARYSVRVSRWKVPEKCEKLYGPVHRSNMQWVPHISICNDGSTCCKSFVSQLQENNLSNGNIEQFGNSLEFFAVHDGAKKHSCFQNRLNQLDCKIGLDDIVNLNKTTGPIQYSTRKSTHAPVGN